MNKFFKKILVLLLALTVAFAAVGCDSCNEGDGDGGSTTPTTPNTSILQPKTPEISMKATNDLIVGDDFYLSPTLKNVKGDLLWTSSNEDVAEVSQDGVVSAKTVGTATVTASYGGVSATTQINVSYGDYIPNVATYSGLDVLNEAKNVLAVGNTYTLGAYVDFNNKVFGDATFTYQSSNTEVLSIDANGVITPNKYGESVTVTVSGTWRDFTINKSFNVDVRENVLFYIDGNILQNIVVNTPATYIPLEERGNVINLNPSVKAGPQATVDNNVSIEVVPTSGLVDGVDYSFDATSNVYTALALGKSLVNVSYVYEGSTYVANFSIEAIRPVKEIIAPVDLYSAGAGTYKVKVGDSYVNKTLVDYAWGNGDDVTDVELYDAYQEGTSLKVNGEFVEDVAVNFDDYTDTSITIGTKTECYTVYLNDACSYYISDADDVIGALDKTNRTYSSTGMYIMLNDVDMADAPAITNTNSQVIFHGLFDGRGYAIYNLVVEMKASTNNGMFGKLQSGTKIKNLAIIDVSSINNIDSKTGKYTNLPNNGWLTSSYGTETSSLVLENVFVQTTPEMRNHAGMLVKYLGTATNVVINEQTSADFDIENWFLDTNNHYYGSGALSRISSEYAYTASNYSSATSKLSGVYIISRKPVHYSQTKSTATKTDYSEFEPTYNSDFTVSATNDAITYAENETELWRVYDYFTNPTAVGGLGLKNPDVQSVFSAINGANTKIYIAKNLRRYDSYTALSLDEADKHATNLVNFTSSPYWTIVNGTPVWKSVYNNALLHDDYFGILMGGKDATYGAVVKNFGEYDLALSTLNNEFVTNLVFSTDDSSFFTIKDNKLKATAVSYGATATVTANFKYNGVDKSISIQVEVVDPFDVAINDALVEDGIKLDIDGEYKFSILVDGVAIENVTYTSNATSVMALKSGSTDTFTSLTTGNATITASFTYEDKTQTRVFELEVIDAIGERGVLLVNGKAFNGSISVNAYDTAIVTVSLDGVDFDASKISLTSNDTTLATVSGNVITIAKYVENGSVSVSGKLTEKGREYPFNIIIEIEDPFKLAINNANVSAQDGKALDLYSSNNLAVTVNGNAIADVTYTTTASNVTLDGTSLTVKSLGADATLAATFTYGANVDHTITIPVTFFDSVLDKSVLTVNGVDLIGESIEVDMPGAATIGVKYDGVVVNSVTLAGYDGYATVSGTTLTTVTHGSFNLSVTFVVNDKNHVIVVPVSFAYPSVTIDTAIDYDASTGALLTTAIEGEVFAVNVGDQVLTTDNGGLTIESGVIKLRAKTSETDTLAGVPYIWNRIGTTNKLNVSVLTDVNTYVLTNVSYYTMLISDVDDLKQALGTNVDYTILSSKDGYVDAEVQYNGNGFLTIDSYYSYGATYYEGVFNVGIYKLAGDIDMEGTDIGYTYDMGTNIGGYAGMLDGAGYSIKNFEPGAKGLLDVMNTYVYGSIKDNVFGSEQLNYRSIPANPTIKNIAFEDVVTTTESPVIARVTGQAQDFQGRDVIINNVYVTVSDEAAGFGGVVKSAYRATTMNNVYVVNTNDYDNFMTLDNSYRIATREGVTVDPEGSYYIPFTAEKYRDVSLIGKLADPNPLKITGVVEDIQNVYVVSNLPVTYYNDFLASDRYAYNYLTRNADAKTVALTTSYLGGYNGSKYIAYGYASNETQGNILTAYKLRDNIMSEFTANYDLYTGDGIYTFGFYGYFCETCGEATLGGAVKTLTTCPTENCLGTPVKNYGVSQNGFWNSPAAYEWTVHSMSELGTEFATTNGAYEFDGVKKYASVDAMKSATNDFTSFLENGNGMWTVVEGELQWIGA